MPTGYTADVESGKITDFRTFALRCARAFGACVMQRENDMNELPKHREVSDYHQKSIENAVTELKRLKAMTPAQVEAECLQQHKKRLEEWKKSKVNAEVEEKRYQAMLDKVKAWKPPSKDHDNLKKFMIEQLQTSMHGDFIKKYYSTPPEKPAPGDWLKSLIEAQEQNVEYHTKEHAEELQRCKEANAWIDVLFESLTP